MATSVCSRRACLYTQSTLSSALPPRRWESSKTAVSPPPRTRERFREQRGRSKLVDVNNVDLVGPPDPISNIRPMFYAPITSSSSSSSSLTASTSNSAAPHPYSLHEFSQSSRGSSGLGLGLLKSYRDYVDRVTNQVEEAEMSLRLSKLTNDTITQRFWKDNNIRFNRDLENWREESHRRVAALPDGVMEGGGAAPDEQNKSIEAAAAEELSKDESAFYANWLQANGRRNRAYNVLVWKQAWRQVRLGARVTYLRNWLKTLRAVQGR